MLKIADVMTREVLTVHPDMTLTELDEHLVEAQVSGAPVVEDGRVVGIISQTDVIRVLFGEQREAQKVSAFYGSPFPIPIPALEHLAQDTRRIADHMTKLRVRDIASPAPGRVAPDTPVDEVARIMSRDGFHRILVAEGEKIVGIVSAMDIVRFVGERGAAA